MKGGLALDRNHGLYRREVKEDLDQAQFLHQYSLETCLLSSQSAAFTLFVLRSPETIHCTS